MKSARKLSKELVMLKKAQWLEYTIKPLRKTTEAEDAEQSLKKHLKEIIDMRDGHINHQYSWRR